MGIFCGYAASVSIIFRMNHISRFLFASVFLFGVDIQPGMAELSEGQVKAAYVFNFIKFAEWPAGVVAADKVTLCVVGNNVLGGAFAALDGRKAGDRELHVIRYANADSELKSCNVVFIGESEQRHFVFILKALGESSVLTISDIEDFAEKGGAIGLLHHQNKIAFEINLKSLQRSNLRLPGQLLNLASQVFGR